MTLLELAAQAARKDGLLPESSCHCPGGRTAPSPLWVPGERRVAPSGSPRAGNRSLGEKAVDEASLSRVHGELGRVEWT